MGKPHKNAPHVHAELIKAWADGAEIEFFENICHAWLDCTNNQPSWDKFTAYRIKPEPKPDIVRWIYGRKNMGYDTFENACDEFNDAKPNLKLIFDGETGKLKSAEVL